MTESQNEKDKRLAQLEKVLELYGARAERWPEESRAGLSAFAAQDPDAARLLAEARALEKLLCLAPGAGPSAGLEARILAAAAATPQQGRAGATPIRLPGDGGGALLAIRPAHPVRRMWPELALLAASLVAGLMIGLSGQALPVLQNVAVITDDDGMGPLSSLLFDAGADPDQGAL